MFKNMVNQIFYEKLENIQSKIPVKLKMSKINHQSFSEVFHNKISLPENTNKLNNIDLPGSNNYDAIINEVSSRYNISSSMIKSVIWAESSFNPNAVSSAGAQGLMQLMPLTAKHLGVKNVWDPKQNIEGGTKYLRELIDKYNGDIKLALAAYNAGPFNVDKYQGIPPFKETQNYVNKVMNNISKFI